MVLTFTAALFATAHLAGHHHRRPHHPPPRFYNAVASYYTGIGGACGIDAGREVDGVANKTLPCGTWLTVCARACAVVQVIDRGPYVWGREYDLSQNVAEAIGFPLGAGVSTVRVSIHRR